MKEKKRDEKKSMRLLYRLNKHYVSMMTVNNKPRKSRLIIMN